MFTSVKGFIQSTEKHTVQAVKVPFQLTEQHTDPVSIVSVIQEALPYLTAQIQPKILTQYGHSIHTMLMHCTFNERPCNVYELIFCIINASSL